MEELGLSVPGLKKKIKEALAKKVRWSLKSVV
jgi:hypothetical protein